MELEPILTALLYDAQNTAFKAKPKVIRLRNYGVGDNNLEIVINTLLLTGEGIVSINDAGTFWNDVKTERPLELRHNFDVFTILFKNVIVVMNKNNNVVVQVSASALMAFPGGSMGNVHLNISYTGNGNGASIAVKVDTVSITTTTAET